MMLQAAQWEGRLLELGAVHGPRAHPLSRAVLVALDVGVAVSTACQVPVSTRKTNGLSASSDSAVCRFKTANNLAHDGGIAANPRQHAVGLFPPW